MCHLLTVIVLVKSRDTTNVHCAPLQASMITQWQGVGLHYSVLPITHGYQHNFPVSFNHPVFIFYMVVEYLGSIKRERGAHC